MIDTAENNKRIAKNVFLLYIRMALLMFISFYTSRIVLKNLGITDFGLYNVVAGFIAMLGFIQGSMSNGIQRFMSYAIKNSNEYDVNTIFIASVRILITICLVILLLAETIGLWFVYNKMSIPHERINTVIWVYQLSVLQTIVSLLSIPYYALIIAYERMNAFAYISILEAVSKLSIAIILSFSMIDKLLLYAILMFIVQLIIRITYNLYCKKYIYKIKLNGSCDIKIIKRLLTYIGWNTTSICSEIIQIQGLNILLNIFFGPILNAARGISIQVMGVVRNFSINFLMAINPQIIKSYASGDLRYTESLVFKASRFGFMIMFCISAPVIMITDDLLNLWLVEVPQYGDIFIKIILCSSMINVLIDPIKTAINATGKIKYFNICISIMLLSSIPISFFLLKKNAEAYSVFIVQCIINLIIVVISVYFMKRIIRINQIRYYKDVIMRVIFVSIIVFSIMFIMLNIQTNEIYWHFINAFILFITTIITVSLIGVKANERRKIIKYIRKKI